MSITKAHIDKKKAVLRNLKDHTSVALSTFVYKQHGQEREDLEIDEETRQFLIKRLSKQLKHDVEQYTSELKEEVNKLIG